VKWRFLIAIVCISAAYGQVDPKALVRQSVEHYERGWRAAMSWAYTQTDVTTAEDGQEAEVLEVVPLDGTPYDRVVMKNGRKLTPDEQRKEDRKYQKALKQRESETPAEREARIRKYENERAFIKEIPNAYSFKLLGDEPVEGRPAWILEMTPRPDFTPSIPHASMLQHIEGKLWIDKKEVQWAKAEAHVSEPISIGWILARIGRGAHIKLQQTRIAEGLWMPKQITVNGIARVLMVHTKNLNEQLTFSGYHKESESSAGKAAKPAQSDAKSFR
jgi:hypothetical protein